MPGAADVDEVPGRAGLHVILRPAAAGGDDGAAARRRLQPGHPKPLAGRRHQPAVAAPVELRDLVLRGTEEELKILRRVVRRQQRLVPKGDHPQPRQAALRDPDRLECRRRVLPLHLAVLQPHRGSVLLAARLGVELRPVHAVRHQHGPRVAILLDHQPLEPAGDHEFHRPLAVHRLHALRLPGEDFVVADEMGLGALRPGPRAHPLERLPPGPDDEVGVGDVRVMDLISRDRNQPGRRGLQVVRGRAGPFAQRLDRSTGKAADV